VLARGAVAEQQLDGVGCGHPTRFKLFDVCGELQ
jgi:hypothetical protein